MKINSTSLFLCIVALGVLTGCKQELPSQPGNEAGNEAANTVENSVIAGPQSTPASSVHLADISKIALASDCAKELRHEAKPGYVEGLTLVFARSLCRPNNAEVAEASVATRRTGASDALDVYRPQMEAMGMTDATAGPDKLRYTYVMLFGLGIDESSGRYCMGRYMRDPFSGADSAEAGIFQTSWGAHRKATSLAGLMDRYAADESACMLPTFSRGVSCPAADAVNWGPDGARGKHWQGLTKRCPAFATEYAAVIVRQKGGTKEQGGEFGPIRRGIVKVSGKCNAMLSNVQTLVRDNPGICAEF